MLLRGQFLELGDNLAKRVARRQPSAKNRLGIRDQLGDLFLAIRRMHGRLPKSDT
ncbi:hypothetical protein D3C83_307250 [compost metagenome]